jgi:hypothetical protein
MKRKSREPITIDAQTNTFEKTPIGHQTIHARSARVLVHDPIQIAALRAKQIRSFGKVVSSDDFLTGGIAIAASYLINRFLNER